MSILSKMFLLDVTKYPLNIYKNMHFVCNHFSGRHSLKTYCPLTAISLYYDINCKLFDLFLLLQLFYKCYIYKFMILFLCAMRTFSDVMKLWTFSSTKLKIWHSTNSSYWKPNICTDVCYENSVVHQNNVPQLLHILLS